MLDHTCSMELMRCEPTRQRKRENVYRKPIGAANLNITLYNYDLSFCSLFTYNWMFRRDQVEWKSPKRMFSFSICLRYRLWLRMTLKGISQRCVITSVDGNKALSWLDHSRSLSGNYVESFVSSAEDRNKLILIRVLLLLMRNVNNSIVCYNKSFAVTLSTAKVLTFRPFENK